jgi:hypothetical protein
MLTAYRIPDARTRIALDVFVIAWIAAWITLGVVVGRDVRGLEDLSDTTVTAGRAIISTGEALGALENVPFVGGDVGRVAEQAREAGRSAIESGRSSRDSIHDLSVLLAIAIGLVPSLPLLLMYLPVRISWTRQIRVVRRALTREASDPALTEFLARRAAQNLPYDVLYGISASPWRDLEAGRFDRLAEAEIRRLGLSAIRNRG